MVPPSAPHSRRWRRRSRPGRLTFQHGHGDHDPHDPHLVCCPSAGRASGASVVGKLQPLLVVLLGVLLCGETAEKFRAQSRGPFRGNGLPRWSLRGSQQGCIGVAILRRHDHGQRNRLFRGLVETGLDIDAVSSNRGTLPCSSTRTASRQTCCFDRASAAPRADRHVGAVVTGRPSVVAGT